MLTSLVLGITVLGDVAVALTEGGKGGVYDGDFLRWRPKYELVTKEALKIFKILLPAALPYMFTGFRLSLGIAWLVIVAAEMLTGAPGVGGFLWQEYNSLIDEHILLCILTIGLVGFALDRLMGLVEVRLGGT